MQSRNRTLGAVALMSITAGAALIGMALFSGQPGSGTTPNLIGGLRITYFPTPTVPATAAPAAAAESIAAQALPLAAAPPESSPTPRAAQYVVQANDTLWDIALRFGFASPDAIVAANPGLNPDFLSLGQVLTIPGLDFVPAPTSQSAASAPQAGANAANTPTITRVRADGGGLRLRREPQVADNIITKLSPLTPLTILGRSADNAWLQVSTQNSTTGWVMSQYVEDPSFGQTVAESAAVQALPVLATAAPASAVSVQPVEYPPYLSDLSPRVYDIYRLGQSRGNRPNVFALIGDSNTENPKFLRPFDWGQYNLGNYSHLEETVRFFKGSFDRSSPAARGGFGTEKVLNAANSDAGCAGQTPLACELNLQRPSVALVLIGTGDQHSWQGFEGRFRQIVETCISNGVIPVLMTKGDDLEHRDNSAPSGYINSVIRRVSAEYQVPLLNLSQVLDTLPARGFIEDGFHYNWPPDNRSADLTYDKLIYGFNQRNLTALQALDVIRRRVLVAS